MAFETLSSHPKTLGKLITFFTLTAILLVGVLSHQWYNRIDLTAQGMFTLSPRTREIITQLPDPLEVTYFLTPRLAAEIPEILIIQDLLREMERIQPNLFRLSIVDPETHSGPSPEDLGIRPQQYQVIEANQQSVALVYSGIALSFRDSFTSLPLVTDPRLIEYDLVRSILELIEVRRPRIGILLGDSQLETSSQILVSQVQATYDLELLSPGDDISPDLVAVLVLGHQELSVNDVFALDQFIVSGGSVFLGIHYHSVNIAQGLIPVEGSQTPLLDLIKSFGIEVLPQWVTDTQNQPIPVQQSQGRVMFTALQDYLLWPSISATRANLSHPVTKGFSGLDGFWMSPLVLRNSSEQIEVTEILRTNRGSGSLSMPLNTDPRTIQLMNIQPDGFPIGFALEGVFSSSFSQPPLGQEHRFFQHEGTGASRVLILGDQFLFSDLIQVNQSFQNLDFLQNVLEWLAREDDLLAMRSRTIRNTSLDRIQDPMIRSTRISVAQFLGLTVSPGIVLMAGLIRFFKRRKLV